jgi:hypothetical protein
MFRDKSHLRRYYGIIHPWGFLHHVNRLYLSEIFHSLRPSHRVLHILCLWLVGRLFFSFAYEDGVLWNYHSQSYLDNVRFDRDDDSAMAGFGDYSYHHILFVKAGAAINFDIGCFPAQLPCVFIDGDSLWYSRHNGRDHYGNSKHYGA